MEPKEKPYYQNFINQLLIDGKYTREEVQKIASDIVLHVMNSLASEGGMANAFTPELLDTRIIEAFSDFLKYRK